MLVGAGLLLALAGAASLFAGEGPAALLVRRDEGVPVARFSPERAEEPRTVRLAGLVRAASDGSPIAGALACDHPAFDAPELCVATTPDGGFSLEVPSGLHKLEVIAPAGSRYVDEWFEDRDRSRRATLLDLRKAGARDLVVALATGRRVTGRLVTRRDGAAVADAQACASPYDRDGAWTCVRTDGDGRYAMTVLPGRYNVFFVPPDRARLRAIWWADGDDVLGADTLEVTRGDADGIDGSFPEGAVIAGTVRSAGGYPLERVFVCVDTPFPTGRICRPTDRDGRYAITVRRSTYLVQFKPRLKERAIGKWLGDTADPKAARLLVVNGDVPVDATLDSGRLLWGRITTAREGFPLEGATVNVYHSDRACCVLAAATVTGMSGDYAVVVRPGRYWVEAFPPFGSSYLSSFDGGPTVEQARAVVVGDREDRNYSDIALLDFEAP